jgi:hypothetical protein
MYGMYQSNSNAKNYFAGNVGIGTTSPSTKVEVNTSSQSDNSRRFITVVDNELNGLISGFKSDRIIGTMEIGMEDNALAPGGGIKVTGKGIVEPSFSIYMDSNEAMTINYNGLVSFGDITPDAKLDVAASSSQELMDLSKHDSVPNIKIHRSQTFFGVNGHQLGSLEVTGESSTGVTRTYTHIKTISDSASNGAESGTLAFETISGGAVAERMRIDGDKIGIGTTAPEAQLHIFESDVGGSAANADADNLIIEGNSGNAAGLSIMSGTTGSGRIYFGDTDASLRGYFIYDHNTDSMRIATASNERVFIDSSGNFGIGTNNPAHKLDVNGNIAVAGTSVHTSDRRLKEDITPLENSIEKLFQIRGVKYFWKDRSVSEKRQIGVIAQEVQKVFPELVYENAGTGYLGVNYQGLIGPLIDATKEQQLAIETNLKMYLAMQGRLDQIESINREQDRKIASLEEENEQIKAENTEIKRENELIKSFLCQKHPDAPFCL